MPKYKVNFVHATFYPQVLGEKIVQRLTVNGIHYANTSRKILHSNYSCFMLKYKQIYLKFYANFAFRGFPIDF